MLDIWALELKNMVPVREVNLGIITQGLSFVLFCFYFNNQNSFAILVCFPS